MSGFVLDVSGEKVSAPSAGFGPLPTGKYVMSVFDVTPGEFGNNGPNAGRANWNVQFRVSDGQEGANRRVFQTVGLFPSWAPTEKNPEGSDNFTFYQFFAAVQGKSEADFREEVKKAVEGKGKLKLPQPEEILGKEVQITLGIEFDEYKWRKDGAVEDAKDSEEYKRNNVRNIKALAKDEGDKPKVTRL